MLFISVDLSYSLTQFGIELFFFFLEFQRKVMFQLSEIKNLLVDRVTHFSIDLEENFKQCKSSDELNVLERKIAGGDIQYITFVCMNTNIFFFIVYMVVETQLIP